RGNDDRRAPGATDERAQRAAVERVETGASPPPAECRGEHRDSGEPALRAREGECGDEPERGENGQTAHPLEIRRSEPEAERGDADVRRSDTIGHGTTRPRRFSIRAGPMPGIASSSSTEVNGPCACL